ncbi:MAG: SUMF1/EgtB/PvdO family nonheme iron enzyme [Bradymonadales bacterium]|nr:SUMF1/EgtB/PvdO family nonheme iron enzyme [Bradymonadales bacterium]
MRNHRYLPLAKTLAALLCTLLPVASGRPGWAQERRPHAPQVDLSEMAAIPAGTFTMGIDDMETGPYGNFWFVDQQPAHPVALEAFYLDLHEVTVAQFALFLTYAGGEYHFHPDQPIERVDGGYLPIRETDQEPIRQVTWEAAHHYCLWAGKRLPTEAEWERAAAGAERRPFPWGDLGPTCRTAAFFTGASRCEAAPVSVHGRPEGTTPEGVAQMAGNVAEWVADWYGPYPAGEQEIDNPVGPETGSRRVFRGGSYLDSADWIRTTARRSSPPQLRSSTLGFRCAWSEPAQDGALRGELVPPEDIGRQTTDPPLALPAPQPAILVEGLEAPGPLVRLSQAIYTIDWARGELVRIDQDGGSFDVILDGLGTRGDMTATETTVLFTDSDSGRVLSYRPPDEPIVLAEGQSAPFRIVADDLEVYWSTTEGVTRLEVGAGPPQPLVEVEGTVTALALSNSLLYFATRPSGDLGASQIATCPRSGGPTTVILSASEFTGGYYPQDIALDQTAAELYYLRRYSSWPEGGWLCRAGLDGSARIRLTHSPVRMDRLVLGPTHIYWTTQHNLVRLIRGSFGPYEVVGAVTHPGGVVVETDRVTWTDAHNGRIYAVEL